ncbi:hybrid sensor histidine kinase/response regulator [Pseudaeromonas pectinilytica]
MTDLESQLRARLLQTFLLEASEQLSLMTRTLDELELGGDPVQPLEVFYRAAHSLKGGARIVNLPSLEYLCQSLESVLALLRRQVLSLQPALLELLRQCVENLESQLQGAEAPLPGRLTTRALALRQSLDKLASGSATLPTPPTQPIALDPVAPDPVVPRPPESIVVEPAMQAAPLPLAASQTQDPSAVSVAPAMSAAGSSPPRQINEPMPPAPATKPPQASAPAAAEGLDPLNRVLYPGREESVRLPVARLDDLLLQAEEMTALKLALRQQVLELKGCLDTLSQLRHRQQHSTADEPQDLDRQLADLGKSLLRVKRHGEQEARQAGSLIEKLIADAKALLMFPFASLTEGLAAMLRDIAQEQGKQLTVQIQGESLELDRRILQGLRDPLIHLLRNAIDHGIELPAERERNNKPTRGRILIQARCTEQGKAEILIQDDGRGIDRQALQEAALRDGYLTAEQVSQLGDEEALQLIFRSGLSTRREVSHLSGRGLGMAIVQEQIEKLGGHIRVSSQTAQGTRFVLELPLALASFRGIQIRVGQRRFAVPTLSTQRVLRLDSSQIHSIEGRPTFSLDQRTVPIVSLAGLLGIAADAPAASGMQDLLLLGQEQEPIAFAVDDVLGEDDLLVKQLGPQLLRVRHIAGVSVLGDGTLLPLLNTHDLLKSARGAPSQLPAVFESDEPRASTAHRILVVDDSITSRTLLKNVLESYGYEVKTACDGLDALTLLQSETFDLVSSDVEMPKMDGFELTAHLRADEQFSRLPVVLVTSLESVEDRQRGVDVGADAYIVKSSFDQSNLLEIIRKFL